MNRLASLLLLSIVLVGCASEPAREISPTAEGFVGFPPAVVTERLGDPVFFAALTAQPPAEQMRMAQLQVASTLFCREYFAAYRDWLITGLPPDDVTFIRPKYPEPGFEDFALSWEALAEDAITSNDPAVVHAQLLALGGCVDVIADPATGPATIGEILSGQSIS